MSEVVKHYFPKMVDLHNYVKTNQVSKKVYNWKALNQKVFRRMGFLISDEDIDAVARGDKGAVEEVLLFVQEKMAEYKEARAAKRASGGKGGTPPPGHFTPPPPVASASGRSSPRREAMGGAGAGAASASPGAARPAPSYHGRGGGRHAGAVASDVEELRETVEILLAKVDRLEQLLSAKDSKVEMLSRRVDALTRR